MSEIGARKFLFSNGGCFRKSSPGRAGRAPGVFEYGYLLTLFLDPAAPTTGLLRRSDHFVRPLLLPSAFTRLDEARPMIDRVALAPEQPNTLEQQSNEVTLLMNSGFFEHPSQVTATR